MSTSEHIITIHPGGLCEWLGSRELDPLEDALGLSARIRLSHIEPVNILLRVAFLLIRYCVADGGAIAGWTRRWPCLWRVRIFNGPTWGRFSDRAEAIQAEHEWLASHGERVVRRAIGCGGHNIAGRHGPSLARREVG